MINKAAEALVELINEEDLARRATFPENVEIREIAAHLAAKVFIQAVEENLVVRLEFQTWIYKTFCNYFKSIYADTKQIYAGGLHPRWGGGTEDLHLL